MTALLTYRGRAITEEDAAFIRELIASHPEASRRRLSKILCEAWDWRQPNGALRDMICRSLMLALHRAGHIELPVKRQVSRNYLAHRILPEPLPLLSWPPVEGPFSLLGPLSIRQVRRTAEERLFGRLMQTHHYLGYTQPVGEHLKHMVWAGEMPVACLAWSSPPRRLGCRDRFIGWTPEVRKRNLRMIAYNSRFLILPWVRVKHLASHLLGRMARRISADWEALYRHPIWFLETFVDRERFAGTCYRAANWVLLGQTAGRGNNAPTHEVTRSIKDMLGYPLAPDFRERLCAP